jgi:anthranilate/para-aminobenzoate synthase component I
VNIARRFRLAVRGDAVSVLAAMSRRARAPFAAALRLGELSVVSTSPELLLALDPSGRIWSSPIKGTRPRGADAPTDRALARELDADPKERAELAMILDVERNDLGRVAATGSVRLLSPPRIVTHPTLHHRVATVGGRLRPGAGRRELFEAMLPSGSVTGAPKIRAMEVIAELEPERRGLYTGGFGAVRQDGGVRLAMAIRTLTIRAGEGHYFSGGGIVADSDPDRELAETRWKAVQLGI